MQQEEQQLEYNPVLPEICRLFQDQMPFNQLLGLELTRVTAEGVEVRFSMKNELVGNPILNILHGGVTASVLDVAGGLVVIAAVCQRLPHADPAEVRKRLGKLGTIDLRVDYLRPGRGEEFITTAHVIRSGSRVAVARMEMHNEQGRHIAFGTGTYMVG